MKKLLLLSAISIMMSGWPEKGFSQANPYTTVTLTPDVSYQTMTGFGASLAFYEGWLTAHPKKSEIYDVIFKELSLDILRVAIGMSYN